MIYAPSVCRQFLASAHCASRANLRSGNNQELEFSMGLPGLFEITQPRDLAGGIRHSSMGLARKE